MIKTVLIINSEENPGDRYMITMDNIVYVGNYGAGEDAGKVRISILGRLAPVELVGKDATGFIEAYLKYLKDYEVDK